MPGILKNLRSTKIWDLVNVDNIDDNIQASLNYCIFVFVHIEKADFLPSTENKINT